LVSSCTRFSAASGVHYATGNWISPPPGA